MILFFAGIIAGIIVGIGGSALFVVWRELQEDVATEGDLGDLIHDITPVETPFLSEIERHRQAHLAAQGREIEAALAHKRGEI